MRDPEFAKLKLEDRLIDRMAQEVAHATGAALLIAHAPRALIDLNRAPDDIDWSMIVGPGVSKGAASGVSSAANRRARGGLGLIPRRVPGYGEIWKGGITREELDRRIEAVHRPYHTALGQMLERVRDKWGAVLLLDLHSMPPLKAGRSGEEPAEFVIGDRFGSSCHDMLSAGALAFLASAERRVSHNRPYSGGYILERHAATRRGIHALQLEICRSAYLDGELREVGPRFTGVARLVAQLVRTLAGQLMELRTDSPLRQAAE